MDGVCIGLTSSNRVTFVRNSTGAGLPRQQQNSLCGTVRARRNPLPYS